MKMMMKCVLATMMFACSIGIVLGGCGGSEPSDGSFSGCQSAIEEMTGSSGPCGGDPSGTWDVDYSCFTGGYRVPLQDKCPGATVAGQKSFTGTVSFDSATCDLDIQGSSEIDLVYPLGCFPLNILAEDCAELGELLTLENIQDATCTEDAESCSCRLTSSQDLSISESYTIHGNGFMEVGAGEFFYCNRGAQMALSDDDGNILVLNRI